jgi:hypothetical protein
LDVPHQLTADMDSTIGAVYCAGTHTASAIVPQPQAFAR